MQNTRQTEIILAYNLTMLRLTPQERDEWDELYQQAHYEGRLHHYAWNYWS